MAKRLLALAGALFIAAAIGYADQPVNKVVIPVKKTSPWNGKQMYADYCAPCHGQNGKGDGPVATALRIPPTDLSTLARNNNGKYPDAHVLSVLKFGGDLPAHGSAQMPVWGPILSQMAVHNDQEQRVRLFNLSRYIETLQAK